MKKYLCLLDAGNTSIKLSIATRDEIIASFVFSSNEQKTADSIGLRMHAICSFLKISPNDFEAWVFSSVVPSFDGLFTRAGERYADCPVYCIPTDILLNLEIKYGSPKEIGSDRLVGAFGARQMWKDRSIIVVDFGTATTFDCIQDNAYLGGLIFPGILSSLGNLSSATAKLPQIKLEFESSELNFWTDTRTSLNTGIIFGFASLLEGLSAKLKNKLNDEQARIVVTGGFARTIQQATKCIDNIQPDLLIQGLRMAYNDYIQGR